MRPTVYSVSSVVSTSSFSVQLIQFYWLRKPCHSEEPRLLSAGGRRGIVAGSIHAADDRTQRGSCPCPFSHRGASGTARIPRPQKARPRNDNKRGPSGFYFHFLPLVKYQRDFVARE